ncbi:hypothetical protein SCG7109_AP_00170 [Chlamydiales bacterium SCGC AG-110-M15]|nr:hypothetical protein SCG7109_AP_00170 [Chlamydiales bacterium SCGC AG-110-M15]
MLDCATSRIGHIQEKTYDTLSGTWHASRNALGNTWKITNGGVEGSTTLLKLLANSANFIAILSTSNPVFSGLSDCSDSFETFASNCNFSRGLLANFYVIRDLSPRDKAKGRRHRDRISKINRILAICINISIPLKACTPTLCSKNMTIIGIVGGTCSLIIVAFHVTNLARHSLHAYQGNRVIKKSQMAQRISQVSTPYLHKAIEKAVNKHMLNPVKRQEAITQYALLKLYRVENPTLSESIAEAVNISLNKAEIKEAVIISALKANHNLSQDREADHMDELDFWFEYFKSKERLDQAVLERRLALVSLAASIASLAVIIITHYALLSTLGAAGVGFGSSAIGTWKWFVKQKKVDTPLLDSLQSASD